jgi:hypothetical protein
MTCQDARDIFPELLDPRAAATPHHEVRIHLANCPTCQRDFAALAQTVNALDTLTTPEPSPRLREAFHAMLEQEKHAATGERATARPASRTPGAWRRSRWRRVLSPLAGCALLALGFIAGQRSIPPAPAPQSNISLPQDDATKRELVALREQINEQRQQLDKMTTLVGYSILQQQQNPANERLRDVLAAARSERFNDKVIDDLIQALTLDPSANVRLRALEALSSHAERATVRAGVLAALPREQNPLVQLELIDFAATALDHDAAPLLERISRDETTHRTVRDAARLALAQF